PGRGRAASTPTLFAGQSLSISGSKNAFCGFAHSNGSVSVTGTQTFMSGPLEYVTTADVKNNANLTAVASAPMAMPLPPHDLAYYRAKAQAQGTYYAGFATLSADNLGMNGVIFAETGMKLSGNHATGKAT